MEGEENNKNENFDMIVQSVPDLGKQVVPSYKKALILIITIGILFILLALAIILPLKLIKDDEKSPEEITPSVIDQYPDDIGGKIIYVTGHQSPDTDTITSVITMANFEKLIGNKNDVIPVRLGEINFETKYALEYFKVPVPILIEKATEADGGVILVDHNQPSQGPNDIDQCKVIKVVDHHALTGLETIDPTFIHIRPFGSTQTVIYELYKQYNVPISKEIAGLMISGIISDTLLLKLAIATNNDKSALETLSKIAGVNYEEYGKKMIIAGTNISGYTEEELINLDAKSYSVNNYNLRIAVLNSGNVTEVLLRKKILLDAIDNYIEDNNFDYFILCIVDIFTLDSTALVGGEYMNATEEAFNVTLFDRQAFLPGISSRKLNIYPYIAEVFKSYPKKP